MRECAWVHTIVYACRDYSFVQNLDANALTVNFFALDPLFEIVQHATWVGMSAAPRPRACKMHVAGEKRRFRSYPSYIRAV